MAISLMMGVGVLRIISPRNVRVIMMFVMKFMMLGVVRIVVPLRCIIIPLWRISTFGGSCTFRGKQAAECPTDQFGGLLDRSDIRATLDHIIDHFSTELSVGILTSAVLQGDFDLVAGCKKFVDLLNFMGQIVCFHTRMEFDLFDLRNLLVLTRLFVLNAFLVAELPIIHDLTDRWFCIGRNLNEVESLLIRKPLRITCRHYAFHLAIGINDADIGDTDFEVNSCERCDIAPPFFDRVLVDLLFICYTPYREGMGLLPLSPKSGIPSSLLTLP